MDSDEAQRKIRGAVAKGRIEYASQDGVESFPNEFVSEFLRDICGAGGAWISDESSMHDFFTTFDPEHKEKLELAYEKAEAKYGVDVRGKHNLLDIFRMIHAQNRTTQ